MNKRQYEKTMNIIDEAKEKAINLKDRINKVTRVEVIDENGRSYVNWDKNNSVKLSYQDDDRTLKIFIDKKE